MTARNNESWRRRRWWWLDAKVSIRFDSIDSCTLRTWLW